MAEHAAILGMIFSPHHTGARAVKRLAEINLVNGDEAAAMKYLRLLQKTMCYRDWAERRIPGKQTAEVCQWLVAVVVACNGYFAFFCRHSAFTSSSVT